MHWPGWAIIFAAVVGAIAAGFRYAKEILEGIDKVSDLFTELRVRRVARVMQEAQRNFDVERAGKTNRVMVPIPLADIARECRRSEQSVRKCLLVLEKRGKVYEARPGDWLPGKRPRNGANGSDEPKRWDKRH